KNVGTYPLVQTGARWDTSRVPIREAIPLCFTPNGLIGLLLEPIFFAQSISISMTCVDLLMLEIEIGREMVKIGNKAGQNPPTGVK
ncbi:MAG: hypothetical protein V2I66_13040, partial [Halieaceae bacterium]|nr:hypothetical protein [Halieaceae bacterium]